jgi:hypothetical protein
MGDSSRVGAVTGRLNLALLVRNSLRQVEQQLLLQTPLLGVHRGLLPQGK